MAGNTWSVDADVCPGPADINSSVVRSFLLQNKWREVPADGGKTCWQAPITLIGTPHYFSMVDAVKMEVEGDIYTYSAECLMAKERHEDDVRRSDETEAEYFARTGQRHGVYPNW